jgi:hypothetical protein
MRELQRIGGGGPGRNRRSFMTPVEWCQQMHHNHATRNALKQFNSLPKRVRNQTSIFRFFFSTGIQ